jgi:hypothetical protein
MSKHITVEFIGMQPDAIRGQFPLYNLLEPMGTHPVYSTVSLNTIREHGCEPCVVKSRVRYIF